MSEKASARVSPRRVLLVACFGAFLAFLDATIVNVAFPSIRESFPTSSIGSLSWVLNAYNIVFAAFLVVCGRLTDLLGRRRIYAAGIVLFTAASVWCAAAGSLELLVAGRLLQALGAAMLVPASLAIVVDAFSNEHRAHAIGLWGATAAVAAGLGPPLGGALVELGGWRWAFLVNLPFGVVAVLATRSSVVESRAPGRRLVPDIPGALLLAAALGLLNLAVIKGNDWHWLSLRVGGAAALAVVLGLAFVRSSLHHRAPVIDPALVRMPNFGVAGAATIFAGLGFYSYLLTNILWLQYVWGYDVLRAGLALVPGALVAAVVAARLGPLAERLGYRVLVVPGALVWAGAYVWYHQQVGLQPAFWSEWLPGQVLSGIGVGATLPLLGSAALAAVPGGRYATASALVSSARQLGGVLGISVLVLVVGNPTDTGVVGALRDGWLLAVGAFLMVAFVALGIGRVSAAHHGESEEPGRPLVLRPEHAPYDELDDRPADLRLEDVPLFAALPGPARARLASAVRERDVQAGAWLFEEGDPAGSAYIVLSGKLEVVRAGRVIRELAAGALVGELALITREPRSAGLRARRDTRLLELPRDAFEDLLATDIAATRTVLEHVAEDLRTAPTAGPRVRAVRPRVVGVVGMHPGSGATEVADALVRRIGRHVSVVAPGSVDSAGLCAAEASHGCVVLVSDGVAPGDPGAAWHDFCLRQSDAVVLVARSGSSPVPPASAPANLPEVVLLGTAPGPAEREEWVAVTDAWQLTLVEGAVDVDLRALGDRLAGRSLGLVLSGGGARAFAHVGVLRELEENGYLVDRLAGCSIGAVVASIFATGRDGAALEEVCYAEFVRRRPFGDWTLPRHSLARGARSQAGLVRALGADTVMEGLPRQLSLVSTDLVTRTRQVHRRGSAVAAAVASVRLPVLFPPVPTADGRLLIDGGVLDNMPVDLLTEREEGPVLAVNISMGGGSSGTGRRPGPPRIPALGDTLLRTMMIGAGGAVAEAHRLGATVVTPDSRGVGLLEFHQFDQMVAAGREAARALLSEGILDLGAAGPSGLDLRPEGVADPEPLRGIPEPSQ